MSDNFQKNLDQAAKDRGDAQRAADKDRAAAEAKITKATDQAVQVQAKAEAKADSNFVKAADKAEASAMNRDPITDAPGSHPVGTGLGTTGGAVAGAVVGSIAGPLGTLVGGVVGAIAGAGIGHVTGEAVNPTAEEAYWRGAYINEPYYDSNYTFDDYAAAYRRAGLVRRKGAADLTWEQAESDLKTDWMRNKNTSRLRWDQASVASRAAWDRVGPAA